MKKFLLVFTVLFSMFALPSAWAFRSDAFKGWYHIQSQSGAGPSATECMLFDVNTLEEIWKKYAGSPLPEDYVPYKDEPSILIGFTNRDFISLTLEKSALIANGYISIGGGDQAVEMRRRPDGSYDAFVGDGKTEVFYHLSSPQPNCPQNN